MRDWKGLHRHLPLLACLVLGLCSSADGHIIPLNIFGPATGRHHSPDRKYYIYFRNDNEWDPGRFAFYTYTIVNGRRKSTRKFLGKGITNLQQFVWVPNRPHTLLFAVYQNRGRQRTPFLAMWDGSSVRVLRRGKPVDLQSVPSFFSMRGISSDGRTLIFNYFDATANGVENARKQHRLSISPYIAD